MEAIPGFQKKVLIDEDRLRQYEDFYRKQLTQNRIVDEAVQMKAKKSMILENPQIDPHRKKAMMDPMSRRIQRLTKLVRQPIVTQGVDPDFSPELIEAQGPLQNLLQNLATPGPKGDQGEQGPPGLKGKRGKRAKKGVRPVPYVVPSPTSGPRRKIPRTRGQVQKEIEGVSLDAATPSPSPKFSQIPKSELFFSSVIKGATGGLFSSAKKAAADKSAEWYVWE